MGNALSQSFNLPKPTLTEKNCPDQTGRVHIVTGGYTGCGLELVKILYQHNATVYIFGRTAAKYEPAAEKVKSAFPNSTGRLEFIQVDISDLAAIKPAVEQFMAKEKELHVLTLNAGVMFPPVGSKSPQGHDLQLATNCLGPHLLYILLRPTLLSTATSAPPATVRVTWAASLAVDIMSPKPGGIAFEKDSTKPKQIYNQGMYGQSKAGNLLLANYHGKQDMAHNVLHVAWNPGNLATELQRHSSSVEKFVANFLLYPSVFGAYTELYAGLSPDLTMAQTGSYIAPWGRVGSTRSDIQRGCKGEGDGGLGTADKFVGGWCVNESSKFL